MKQHPGLFSSISENARHPKTLMSASPSVLCWSEGSRNLNSRRANSLTAQIPVEQGPKRLVPPCWFLSKPVCSKTSVLRKMLPGSGESASPLPLATPWKGLVSNIQDESCQEDSAQSSELNNPRQRANRSHPMTRPMTKCSDSLQFVSGECVAHCALGVPGPPHRKHSPESPEGFRHSPFHCPFPCPFLPLPLPVYPCRLRQLSNPFVVLSRRTKVEAGPVHNMTRIHCNCEAICANSTRRFPCSSLKYALIIA